MHLWVLLAGPSEGKVLTVNLTDYDNYPDSTCVLLPGDHPFIYKRSSVFYPAYKEWNAIKFESVFKKGGIVNRREDLPVRIFIKVLQGGIVTGDIPDDVKRRYGLVKRAV